jgi:hypothetical protein
MAARIITTSPLLRHARPCAGIHALSRRKKDVDGRDKPGHDDAGTERRIMRLTLQE